jgi:microcin C transport system substrate-binding protein
MTAPRGGRRFGLLTAFSCLLCSLACGWVAAAQVTGAWTYVFSEYGDIKYPEGFDHFDFVNPNAPKGGTLKLSNPDRRTSFDKYNPYTLPNTSPAGVELFVFETLADAGGDEATTMYGLLASQMLVAPDYSSISFRINPLARFTNGDPVSAGDVKYSFDVAVSPVAQPAYSQLFVGVRDAVIVDPRTVRFELKTPSRDQIFQLGTQLYIFSRKWGGLGPDGNPKPFNEIVHDIPIATGPYLINKGTGQMLDLVRDPNYWARNLGVRKGFYNFDHLIYHYYSDEAARFEGFKAGDYDLKEEYSAKRFMREYIGPKFKNGQIIKAYLPRQMGFFYEGFLFNIRRPLFADSRVRDAFNYAFDWTWNAKQYFNITRQFSGLFENTEYAASGLPGPSELALLEPYRRSLPPQVFQVPEPNPRSDTPALLRSNLLHARSLLAAAGWTIHPDGVLRNAKGEAFQFEVMEDNLEFEPILGRWSESLKKLGIAMRLRVVDYAVYQQRLDAYDFDMILLNFGDVKRPTPSLLSVYFGSESARTKGSLNYIGIENPAVDHVLDFMDKATTVEGLVDGARALDRIFIAEHYGVPYQYRPTTMIAYWDHFGMPATLPRFYSVDDGIVAIPWAVETWWDKNLHQGPGGASR